MSMTPRPRVPSPDPAELPEDRTARRDNGRGVPVGLLDVEGVAVRLGVTPRHVRRLVAERRMPFVKWGHLLRFEPADVEAWIAEQRMEALRPRRRSRSGTVR
jgi:excisionase family DNA binding protein